MIESNTAAHRYNPHNSRLMEEYVDAQAMENDYDLEANLLLLKL